MREDKQVYSQLKPTHYERGQTSMEGTEAAYALCLLSVCCTASRGKSCGGGGKIESPLAQQQPQPSKRTITGTVLDANGEPLPGASIYVKGDTKSGVTADAEGRFTLSVPSKTKAIIVSFVGMEPQEVVLLDRTENYVINLESSTTIDEVVVTGIVTKRKDTFTGSSASFSGEELKAVGVQNPLASLRSLDPSFNLSVVSLASWVCATRCRKTPTNLFSFSTASRALWRPFTTSTSTALPP